VGFKVYSKTLARKLCDKNRASRHKLDFYLDKITSISMNIPTILDMSAKTEAKCSKYNAEVFKTLTLDFYKTEKMWKSYKSCIKFQRIMKEPA
jgi:hypothetical protein